MYLYAVAIFNDIFRAALLYNALSSSHYRLSSLTVFWSTGSNTQTRKLGHGNHKPVDSNQVRPPIRHAGDAVDISSSLEAIVWISNYGYSCRLGCLGS